MHGFFHVNIVQDILLLKQTTPSLHLISNDFEGKCHLLTVISLLPLLLIDLLHCSQLLLQLHPPVLEPDLDLSLSETQRVSNLNPASPGEIVVEVELLLQLQSLEPGVGLSASSPGTTIGTFDN